ncbi:MAG: TlpA family protein disulfide reductase [Chloroflexi bacterium]|nr:TlpA family protein disulfide reductase [Chloroflexota bacterium]
MKASKTLFIALGILIAASVGAALYAANRAPALAPSQAREFTPTPAPDFKLELFSGQTIALGDFTGKKPVVINFWASWCVPCRDEAPVLAKVSKFYQGRVEFIGVVVNDTQKNALDFMKEFGITYDNGLDRDNIAVKYRITGIPETFWIDRQGRIVDHWIGAVDEANLTSRVRMVLQ